MATVTVPATCPNCPSGTVYVRLDLSGQDAPELSEPCDLCGCERWSESAADLEERAADILADRGA